jgi:hypothetical protein
VSEYVSLPSEDGLSMTLTIQTFDPPNIILKEISRATPLISRRGAEAQRNNS